MSKRQIKLPGKLGKLLIPKDGDIEKLKKKYPDDKFSLTTVITSDGKPVGNRRSCPCAGRTAVTDTPNTCPSKGWNMTTTETSAATKLARLTELLDQAGELLFERITLAAELIRDTDWIAEGFSGNVDRAANTLEKRYLGDLCGAVQFWRLIALRERFPTIEQWRAKHFNITALSAIFDKEKPKQVREVNRVTLKEYEEVVAEKAHFETLYKNEKVLREKAETALERERERVKAAIRDKAVADGRAAELQRQLDQLRK